MKKIQERSLIISQCILSWIKLQHSFFCSGINENFHNIYHLSSVSNIYGDIMNIVPPMLSQFNKIQIENKNVINIYEVSIKKIRKKFNN